MSTKNKTQNKNSTTSTPTSKETLKRAQSIENATAEVIVETEELTPLQIATAERDALKLELSKLKAEDEAYETVKRNLFLSNVNWAKVKAEESQKAFNEAKAIKVTRTTTPTFGKEDYLRLLIFRAGEEGIDYINLVKESQKYVSYNEEGVGTIDPVNEVTVNHNWNVGTKVLQRGQYQLTLEDKPSDKREGALDIMYDIQLQSNDTYKKKPKGVDTRKATEMRKYNNHITLYDFCADELKSYLLKSGAEDYMFEDDFNGMKLELPKTETND